MRTLEGQSLETHKRALAAAADLVDRLRNAGAKAVELKYKPGALQQYGFNVHATVNFTINEIEVEIEFKGVQRTAHSMQDYGRTLIRYRVEIRAERRWNNAPKVAEKAGKLDIDRVVKTVLAEVEQAKQMRDAASAAGKLNQQCDKAIASLSDAMKLVGEKLHTVSAFVEKTGIADRPFSLRLNYLTEQQLRSLLTTIIERHP